jgi:hypothetical protein
MAVKKTMMKLADLMKKEAKKRAPVKSGKLRDSINAQVHVLPSPSGGKMYTATVYCTAHSQQQTGKKTNYFYGYYLQAGSGSYTSKPNKFLRDGMLSAIRQMLSSGELHKSWFRTLRGKAKKSKLGKRVSVSLTYEI